MTNSGLGLQRPQLTPIQQQRYDLLHPMYGQHAADIVANVYGRGKYSWTSFLEKMDAVEQAKANVKEYYKALYEAFNLYEVYSTGQIIGIVNEVRRDMGLNQYIEKIKLQSEHDFNLVFVVIEQFSAEVVEGVETKKLQGYKPVARVLTPED